MYLKLFIIDKNKNILKLVEGEDEVSISYRGNYERGDKICLEMEQKNVLLKIRLDDSLAESRVFMKNTKFVFEIPFDSQRKPYGQKAFTGERHWGYVSVVTERERENYYNIAMNSFDTRENQVIFPHAITNVKTDNPQFFARNAIDGIFETSSHGSWPHSSWGINQQQDAILRVDFGREIITGEVILYLRADFPHDNWWERLQLFFSDQSYMKIELKKTGEGQKILFPEKEISWIQIEHCIMSNEESKFPALSQIKVMGRESE